MAKVGRSLGAGMGEDQLGVYGGCGCGVEDLMEDNEEAALLRSEDGRGILFWAHEFDQPEMVEFALKLGADPEAIDANGSFPDGREATTAEQVEADRLREEARAALEAEAVQTRALLSPLAVLRLLVSRTAFWHLTLAKALLLCVAIGSFAWMPSFYVRRGSLSLEEV